MFKIMNNQMIFCDISGVNKNGILHTLAFKSLGSVHISLSHFSHNVYLAKMQELIKSDKDIYNVTKDFYFK